MANFISIIQSKKFSRFLNVSFLFLLSLYLKIHLFPSDSSSHHYPVGTLTSTVSHPRFLRDISRNGCTGLHRYDDNKHKCFYVKTHEGCRSKGYIDYLRIFYCNFGQFPLLGHVVLLIWLLVLFYLLGNTAANYFCSSLESLSRILKLSPTIAGVTLLSLGNGAPDVFASIVSFTRSGSGDIGLNSVLGGAFFVSSTVVGVMSILVSPQQISIDKHSFIRDVLFLLFSLLSLLLIIAVGRINLLGAICFTSIYFIYVGIVSATHFFCRTEEIVHSDDEVGEITIPLLGYVGDEKPSFVDKTDVEAQEQTPGFWNRNPAVCSYFGNILRILELPLYLPRRLTIPVVSEEGWSKPYAVISVTLAPLLLAALSNTQRENVGFRNSLATYMTAGLIGIVLGNLAFVTTKKSSPPKRCLFPWLAGGFVMSITWTYIIAEELVSLLVSLGHIIGINPSVLGLTVLAWGNSLGDLIANVALAVNGGADGAQIAIAGCYAGPMFNVLMGLGLSFVLSTWSTYPSCYEIPTDPFVYQTLGFLTGGLLWALVILPKKKMRLDRFLGVGLLTIYFCFLFLRAAGAVGLLKLPGTSFKH